MGACACVRELFTWRCARLRRRRRRRRRRTQREHGRERKRALAEWGEMWTDDDGRRRRQRIVALVACTVIRYLIVLLNLNWTERLWIATITIVHEQSNTYWWTTNNFECTQGPLVLTSSIGLMIWWTLSMIVLLLLEHQHRHSWRAYAREIITRLSLLLVVYAHDKLDAICILNSVLVITETRAERRLQKRRRRRQGFTFEQMTTSPDIL